MTLHPASSNATTACTDGSAADAAQPGNPDVAESTDPRPGRRCTRIVALGSTAVIVAVLALFWWAPPSGVYDSASPLDGHPAPAIVGQSFANGRFDLAALKGRFVLVDFFASWCVPCHIEQPEIIKFVEENFGRVVVVSVIYNDADAFALAMIRPWAGLYPVLPDHGGFIAARYAVTSPPTKYLISPKGIVVARVLGPVTAKGLDALILQKTHHAK